MARAQINYACQSCGTSYKKWQGKCDGCNEWNSIVEEASITSETPKGLKGKKGRAIELTNLSSKSKPLPRLLSGINEFDRTLGGGLVPSSATLLGGDPGIGKSTLLLQVVGGLAKAGHSCVYIS
ncbi:MAG: ATPase domain-containing protein, partial [Sphingomonadales bacterium]